MLVMHLLAFCSHNDQVVHTIVILFKHPPAPLLSRCTNVEPVTLLMRMWPLGPRVRCTLQIDCPSRLFSRLVAQPAVLAFPALQKHNIHQSASTRQDEANRRHKEEAEAVEHSTASLRDNNAPSSSLGTLSTTRDSSKGAAVPPIREPRPHLDEDPNLFPVLPQQSAQVRPNSVIKCCIAVTHNLLGWPCFEGIPCSFYSDRETFPLWK